MKYKKNTSHLDQILVKPKKFSNKVDFPILLIYNIFILLSIILIYSVSSQFSITLANNPYFLFYRHLLGIPLAFIAFFIGFFFPIEYFRKFHLLLFFTILISLVSPFLPGLSTLTAGTKRWISLFGIQLQPSDFTKMLIVFYLAHHITRFKQQESFDSQESKTMLPFSLFSLFCGITILLQKDFSSSILFFSTVLLMFYISGISLKLLIKISIFLTGILIPFILFTPYRLNRIYMLLNLKNDPDSAYQISQSLKAFHLGGFLGTGPSNITHNIPYVFNDFIFAAIGEEFGFIGGGIVILLFFILMIRGFKIAKYIQDTNLYFSLIIFGLIFNITLQSIINMSVSMALIFPTGVSLPFLSYGRTSLIIYSFCIGVILKISKKQYYI